MRMTTVSRLISAVQACFTCRLCFSITAYDNATPRSVMLKHNLRLTLIAAVLSPALALAAAPEPTRDQIRFFEEKVRPILAENCYKCHGSKKQKGSLRLDLPEMALAGGESGPAIVPGKPEQSPLVEAIKWESLEMPPTGKLSESQIATLTEWIRR